MPKKTLNECGEPTQPNPRTLKDPQPICPEEVTKFHSCDGLENLHHAPTAPFQGLDADLLNKREGLGEPNYCDPMLTGKIVDDPELPALPPDRDVVYRYAKGFRSIDEAVKKLFMNIDVIDDEGKVFRVPVQWGSQERAVAAIVQANVRKDDTGVVDRLVLPMLSIYTSDYNLPRERYIYHKAIDYKRGKVWFDTRGNRLGAIGGSPGMTHQERRPNDTVLGVTRGLPVDLGYTITIWTAFWEDMNQILEQITNKFSPVAYIRLQGVTNWENTVRIDSISNNLDLEPGDINKRVFKFQIHVTAESYIPQPIVRRKANLKTRIEISDRIDDSEVQCIVSRIEQAVGEV
jgi:hypothetical protein